MDVQRRLVLVVEDEPMIRMDVAEALRLEGLEVIERASGADALEVVKDRSDLKAICTDINMPGTIDGLELVQIVHSTHPTIALFVASGKSAQFVLSHLPEGARFYPKPYKVLELAKAISASTEFACDRAAEPLEDHQRRSGGVWGN